MTTPPLRTTHDLWTLVNQIGAGAPLPPLADYLRALLRLGRQLGDAPLTLARLAQLLDEARTATPEPYDPGWATDYGAPTPDGTFANWERTLKDQVIDLEEMRETGQLEDPERYFGLTSPRGGRWYNFDVESFLERGVAGLFDDDQTGDVPLDVSWETFADLLRSGQYYE